MSRNEENLNFKIDQELLRTLRRKASETNRSMSDLVKEAIESGLERGGLRSLPDEGSGAAGDSADAGDGKYPAFISYSHADEKIAAATHKLLERFRVPRALVGRETKHGKVPARIRPVFRDREEFPASADLGRSIRTALAAARTLVVICSPRSARSRWVGEEIRQFKQLGRSDRIYCLIADGEPVEASQENNDRAAFHPALLEAFDNRRRQRKGKGAEPLAVDLSEGGLPVASVKLAAGVLGVGYDDLYRRVRRQKFRNRSVLALLAAFLLTAGTWLFVDGLREKRLNRAQRLAVQAGQEVYPARPLAGLALALHALAEAPHRGAGGREPILKIVRDLATRGRVASLGNDVEDVVPSADGIRLAVDHAQARGELRSGRDGALIQELTDPIYQAKFLQDPPGYLIADYRGRAELRIAAGGAPVAKLKSPVSAITFGPDYFFVRYSGGHPNELRRINDGALIPLAAGSRLESIAFNSNAAVPLMIIRYYGNHAPELRRTSDRSVVQLTGTPKNIQFNQGAKSDRILVTYADLPAELLRAEDLSVLRRFDEGPEKVRFLGDPDGRFMGVWRGRTVNLLQSADGMTLATGSKIVGSRNRSHVAVLADNRVVWYRSRTAERLGSIPGSFRKIKFSRDQPPSRLAIQHSGGWELRAIEDGSLVADLPGADEVFLDAELLLLKHPARAEIRRLVDGAVAIQLGPGVKRVHYPGPGLVEVFLKNDVRELRRLSDGSVVKAPLTRNVISDTILGPGSAYQLIRHSGNISELKRSADGTTLMRLGAARAALLELSFIPEAGPSHALARYEDGRSSLIPLEENGDAVSLPGTAVRIDPIPARAPRYLIIRYDDGRAELWRGLEEIRRLGPLGTNLKGHSLASTDSALTLWYADGHADVIDLDWLERATAGDVTDEGLLALACEGPLAEFDAAALDDRLGGDTWRGCPLDLGN